jgi:DNA helicase HerA-like ATPase
MTATRQPASSQTELNRQIELESALRIGQVVEVRGQNVTVQVDRSRNSPHMTFLGRTIKGVSVGTYLRISRGYVHLIGRVTGERISDNLDPNQQYGNRNDRLRRLIDIDLVGRVNLDGHFEGGLAEMPLIANPAYLLTTEELQVVLDIVPEGDERFTIGMLLEDESQPLEVGKNAMIASHIGIFGNTGSGKSNTLAALLEKVFREYRNSQAFRNLARFVVLDFNGEYLAQRDTDEVRSIITADPELKAEFDLGNSNAAHPKLRLPIASAFDLEFWEVVLDATSKTQAPLIRRALNSFSWENALTNEASLKEALKSIVSDMTKDFNDSVERNSPASLFESIADLFTEVLDPEQFDEIARFFREDVALNRTTGAFYFDIPTGSGRPRRVYSDNDEFRTIVNGYIDSLPLAVEALSEIRRFQARVLLQYHQEVARGYSNREYLAPLIKRLETRIPELNEVLEFDDDSGSPKPLTIISLVKLPEDMRRIVGVLAAKYLYAAQKRVGALNGNFLALVVDEAHNILGDSNAFANDQWSDYRIGTFEEIVKEGRKFGAFLYVSSQRPSDISQTIVSQLHNFLIHRLVNNRDIQAVEKVVASLDSYSFSQLPLLARGVCIVAGTALERPALIRVTPLAPTSRPWSETIRPSDHW